MRVRVIAGYKDRVTYGVSIPTAFVEDWKESDVDIVKSGNVLVVSKCE